MESTDAVATNPRHLVRRLPARQPGDHRFLDIDLVSRDAQRSDLRRTLGSYPESPLPDVLDHLQPRPGDCQPGSSAHEFDSAITRRLSSVCRAGPQPTQWVTPSILLLMKS